jgi:prepilin-type N-terminal cleavage/methylation domain-containing protein
MNQARRRRHRHERGLTLIEMLVAIALIMVGVVGLAGGVGNLEKHVQVTSDQTNLEVVMRQITDYLRAPYSGNTSTSTPYVLCAGSYTIPPSIAGQNVFTTGSPAGPLTSAIVTVNEAKSATRVGNTAPFPIEDCTTHAFAPQQPCTVPTAPAVANCDWGIQRLTVTITARSNRSLTRVIYKGIAT